MSTLNRREFLVGAASGGACLAAGGAPARPLNIVVILADDLGFGDVHFLNPEHGRLATPNIDGLATEGVTFTDAHSGSSVCSPTRYGIITGRKAAGAVWQLSRRNVAIHRRYLA